MILNVLVIYKIKNIDGFFKYYWMTSFILLKDFNLYSYLRANLWTTSLPYCMLRTQKCCLWSQMWKTFMWNKMPWQSMWSLRLPKMCCNLLITSLWNTLLSNLNKKRPQDQNVMPSVMNLYVIGNAQNQSVQNLNVNWFVKILDVYQN